MLLIIIFVAIVVSALWWFNSQRRISYNERHYLKQRGYEVESAAEARPPVPKDARLFALIESLSDLSPYSRQKAAEDLLKMCAAGNRDERMLSALTSALEDSDASVRRTAATALGELGDARAIEPLTSLVESEDSIHVRSAAQKALAKLTTD